MGLLPGRFPWFSHALENGKFFPVGETSWNFTQNTGKEGILARFYFYFFSDFLIEVYLLNTLNKTLKKYWKMEKKIWKSQGNLSENVGTVIVFKM